MNEHDESRGLRRQPPEHLRRASAPGAERLRALLDRPAPLRRQFGQIWATRHDPERAEAGDETPLRLVVLVSDESWPVDATHPFVSAAPLSLNVNYAADRDLIVPVEGSPLGHACMVEVWNEATMLVAQLRRCLGELVPPWKRSLGLLYQAQLGTDVDLSELADRVGPPLAGDDDPRVEFQEQERAACEYLRAPVLRLLAAAEEAEEAEEQAPAEVVRMLLRRHLPGALPDEETPDLTPLTVGDVAARLKAEHAGGRLLPAGESGIIVRLAGDPTPVPLPATTSAITGLAQSLGVGGSAAFWERFRREAAKLGMIRRQNEIQRAAARRQYRRGRRPLTEPGGPPTEDRQ